MWNAIERLPRPERNGFKGSVIAVSFWLGLLGAGNSGLVCTRNVRAIQNDHSLAVTQLIFRGSGPTSRKENSSCYLEVRPDDTSQLVTEIVDSEICASVPVELAVWQHVNKLSCAPFPPFVVIRCTTLVITMSDHRRWSFNFDTPASFRILLTRPAARE